MMDFELKERLQNYQNVLSLYTFYKRTIRWLCENLYSLILMVIICEYDENMEILNSEQPKKICKYHELLIKFNDVMKNDFFRKSKREKKQRLFVDWLIFLIFV